MADFSGKIITAEYVNTEYSIIKVLYEQDNTLTAYHLDVDPSHPDFQALEAEGWTQEKIIDATAESKRAQSAAYNAEINQVAKKLAEEMMGMKELQAQKSTLKSEVDKLAEDSDKLAEDNEEAVRAGKNAYSNASFDSLLEHNSDKDSLFKAKLWALELEAVKKQSKEFKAKIRKSKRTTELFGFLDNILQ